LNYNFSDAIQLTAGYLATDSPNPTNGNGLFNGDYSALAQLTLSPSENLIFALTYNHGYFGEGSFGFDNGAKTGGFTGTRLVNGLGATNPISSNSYGVELAWQVADGFQVNAWGAFTDVQLRNVELDGEIWNWALGLAFPDLGKPGNLAGLVAGVQPYLGGLEDNQSFFKNDIPVHLEGFYKIQVSDYISVTPGFVWLLNPNQDRNNEQVVIGTLRTTFEF
jgi:Carbohydrate-selective porin, OprB family